MMAFETATSTRRRVIRRDWTLTARRLTIVVFALCLLVSCEAPPRAPGTVVMASGTDLESGNPLVTVHPLTRQLQRHALFVTLLRLDAQLQPVPYFARTWTWNVARTELTMTLSDQLRWHDGVATTARDVQFTINAALDPLVGSPRAGELRNVTRVDVVADTVVRIVFRAPVQSFPTVLAELPIVPEHLLKNEDRGSYRSNAFARSPVGNGPFRFVDRTVGRRWRFARNADFPVSMGGPPVLEQVVVAVVDEASTKFAGLVSGELDLAGVSPTMASLVERDPTLALETPPALFSTLLAFNTTRAPFNDIRVRRAIALSLDRSRIVQAAVAGYATPAGSAIPPGLPFSMVKPAVRDTAAADSLLTAAGFPRDADGTRRRREPNRGAPLELTLLTVGTGEQSVEQLVQADLRARGINVTIRVAELATFLTLLRAPNKQFDFALTGVPGDIALGHLSALFATAQRGGALDYTGFHSAPLDAALSTAAAASATAAPRAWAEVDNELAREMPVAWLYHARGVQGRSRRLEHVTMDLRGELVSIAQWTRRDTP